MCNEIMQLNEGQKKECKLLAETFLRLAKEGGAFACSDISDMAEYKAFQEKIQRVDDVFMKSVLIFYFETTRGLPCGEEDFWEMLLLGNYKAFELFKRVVVLACASCCFTMSGNFNQEDIFELIETGRNAHIEKKLATLDFALADKMKCTKADKDEIMQILIQFLDINLHTLIHKRWVNGDKTEFFALMNDEIENDSLMVFRHTFLKKYNEIIKTSHDPLYVCYEMIYYLTAYECEGKDLLLKLILLDHFYAFRYFQLSVKGKVAQANFSHAYIFVLCKESRLYSDDHREALYITSMRRLYFYLGETFCDKHSITSTNDYYEVLMKQFDVRMAWYAREHMLLGRKTKFNYFRTISRLTLSGKKVTQTFEDIIEAYLSKVIFNMKEKYPERAKPPWFEDNVFIALLFSPDEIVVKAVQVLRKHSALWAAEFVEKMLYLREREEKVRTISDKIAVKAKRVLVKQYEKGEYCFESGFGRRNNGSFYSNRYKHLR